MDSKLNRNKIYKIIMLITIVALVTFILTTVYMYNKFSTTLGNKYNVTDSNVQLNAKLNSIKKVLEKDYLESINDEKLTEGAIKGYVNGDGDEYTKYFTKEEMEEFKQETDGNYVGIGVYMAKNTRENTILVLSAIKGSPAEAAGIKSGDIIKKVDGVEYTGDDFDKIASYIKGKQGTKVNIEMERDGKRINFEVERKKIEIYPVESKVLENNIGYINLPSFDKDCNKKFKENYENLSKQGIKALIIDLRNNGGGILEEAVEIADYILDKDKTVVITVNKKKEETVEKTKNKSSINLPIVILVNENSASASELFAAAIRENDRAKLVGTKTYGKGVIQELLTLPDGSGLKITTEEYFTPNKNKINKQGITPDIEVESDKEDVENLDNNQNDDMQLQKAIELLK